MKSPRSAYLHIPFCHRRCFYCDFAIVPLGQNVLKRTERRDSLITSYLELIQREISLSPDGPPLSTIYIGGGTPSLLSSLQIGSLLEHLSNHFGIQDGAEITLEIDPATFSKKDLKDFLSIGINRVSLGGQSFDDEVLLNIGRTHTSTQLIQACNWLDQEYRNGKLVSWSLDLIQNLPDHNFHLWEKQIQQAINTSAPHLSIYDLSVEQGTFFELKQKKGELNLPNEDLAVEINNYTNLALLNAGFARYEISSYAKPGHASRHNRMYWNGSGWWGFGMGATSAPWGNRFSRPKTIKSYEQWLLEQEQLGVDKSLEPSSQKNIPLDELLIVGMRRREGVNLKDLAKNWGWNDNQCSEYLEDLMHLWNDFIESGLLVKNGDRIFLSNPNGMDISSHILTEMMIWWESLPDFAVQLPTPLEPECKASL